MENSLFESALYFHCIQDLFIDSLLLTEYEVKDKLDLYNKTNSNNISLHLLCNDELDKNLTFFETNRHFKEINGGDNNLILSMTINGDTPIDIEDFMSKTVCLIEEKIIFQSEEDEDLFDNTNIGIWVIDPLGNFLYRNKVGKHITNRLTKFVDNYDPEIIYLDEKYYLIVPEPDIDNKICYHYAFEITDHELDHLMEKTLKDLSLEASMLAHELKNPLMSIRLGAELLKIENDSYDQKFASIGFDRATIADEIIKNVSQCTDVIKVFLEFYKQKIDSSNLNILDLFKRVRKMLGARGNIIKFNYSKKIEFDINVNESLLILSFYLLFNELISLSDRENIIWEGERNNLEINLFKTEETELLISGSKFSEILQKLFGLPGRLVFFKCLFKLSKISFEYRKNTLKMRFE